MEPPAVLKRPSVKDRDEDILKEQELFLNERLKPCAEVKIEKKPLLSCLGKNAENAEELSVESLESPFNLEIKENFPSLTVPFVFKAPEVAPSNIREKLSKFAERRNKSLFLRQFEEKLLKESVEISGKSSPKLEARLTPIGSGDTRETKCAEKSGIHEENLAKISAMSEKDILEHQRELLKHLNPSVIDFIKNKRKKLSFTSSDTVARPEKPAKETSSRSSNSHSEDKILRKEGRDVCEALLLQESMKNGNPGSSTTSVRDSSKEIEVPEETLQLMDMAKRGNWKNMDKIETDKLEWMSKLPQPKPVNLKTGCTARFDFEGKLVFQSEDIPTHLGLHHHSQDPESAGYSLEELFLLSRSTLESQKVMAIKTLSCIIENNWYGKLDECFDTPLLPILLEAGIVPLLRWSLDDGTSSSIAVSVSAIHSLLVSKPDELCLDMTYCWLHGHLLPHLQSTDIEENDVPLEEMSDTDVIKMDVVKGFLRIDILPRFMYLLQLPVSLPPSVCSLILEICARLAQHSLESAEKVAYYPGLLELVSTKFLPLNWNFIDSFGTST